MLSRIAISALAFDVLWQHHDLGEKPPALEVSSPGTTMEQRAEFEREAWRELEMLGLAQGNRPREDVTAALSPLRRPAVEYYGWFGGGGQDCSAHVAITGTAGLRVVLVGGFVMLDSVSAGFAPESLIAALPPLPPGRDGWFSIPQKLAESDSLLIEALPQESDARRCRQLLEEPRSGAGFFVSASRDQHGHRCVSPAPVHYFDTADGRYVCVRQDGVDGAPWLLVGPADADELASRLRTAQGK